MKNPRGHAIALFSGGLDSALAILLVLQQNIRVTALTFMTHFGCDITDKSSCSKDPYPVSEKFGFDVKMMHLGQKFVDIVRNPKYGHGKNMNPCIDCRILMLQEAAHFMEAVGADFVITGEVLGQRPKSQFRAAMNTVLADSGLEGKLVRPLSAKLFDPTDPEKTGLLDREKLEAISGRSRKRQMELAEKFGLEDYPTPAAGCLLTDRGYSNRLRDLFRHVDQVDFNDLNLLKFGRHFRPDEATKIIVGRNEEENKKILSCRRPQEWIFEAKNAGSPITLLRGPLNDKNIALAASITARYCSRRGQKQIEITRSRNGNGQPDEDVKLLVTPCDETTLDLIRIT